MENTAMVYLSSKNWCIHKEGAIKMKMTVQWKIQVLMRGMWWGWNYTCIHGIL